MFKDGETPGLENPRTRTESRKMDRPHPGRVPVSHPMNPDRIKMLLKINERMKQLDCYLLN